MLARAPCPARRRLFWRRDVLIRIARRSRLRSEAISRKTSMPTDRRIFRGFGPAGRELRGMRVQPLSELEPTIRDWVRAAGLGLSMGKRKAWLNTHP